MMDSTTRLWLALVSLTTVAAGLVAFPGAAFGAEYRNPLLARSADTAGGFYGLVEVAYFDSLDLQEAVDLEGWTAAFDLTMPVSETMQLRLLLPVRTEADAVLVKSGEEIRIEGWGGTFDFATIYFEHQLAGVRGGADRFSYFFGYGHRNGTLKTGTFDEYNHRGQSIHAGARYQRDFSLGRALLDFEFRRYLESDDLNPGSLRSDAFNLFDLTGAWILRPAAVVSPALELAVRTGDNYDNVRVIPELLIGGGRRLEVKLGLPIGLTSGAPDLGVHAQLAWRP